MLSGVHDTKYPAVSDLKYYEVMRYITLMVHFDWIITVLSTMGIPFIVMAIICAVLMERALDDAAQR